MRFHVREFDFEDHAPRHFCYTRYDCFGSERDFLFSDVVTPLGSEKFGGDRLVVRCAEKWICGVRRNGEQDGDAWYDQSPAIHATDISKAAIDSARSNSSPVFQEAKQIFRVPE